MKKIMRVSVLVACLQIVNTVYAENLEVLHFWTSGGEAKALNILKNNVEKKGVTWIDMPVAGGGGESAMTTLRTRVVAGNPPDIVSLMGFDIKDWGKERALSDLNILAEKENWDEIIPNAVQEFSKQNNKWVAAPVNIHSSNWVWANQSLLDKLNIDIPKNWEDFVTALQTIKDAGYVALAHGGQAWQEATIFDGIALSVGGVDFYKSAMIDLDVETLQSEKMIEVFDRMAVLRGFVDKDFSGRDWNLASAMVANGEAAFQIMGDWAKGEFTNAGLIAGKDFTCFRVPGSENSVAFLANQFAMFKTSKDSKKNQEIFSKELLSKKFQTEFNVIKGSVPARVDVSDEAFDVCGKKGIADVGLASKTGNLVGSMAHGHANNASIKNVFYDVITAHFNKEYDSKIAVKELVTGINLVK